MDTIKPHVYFNQTCKKCGAKYKATVETNLCANCFYECDM